MFVATDDQFNEPILRYLSATTEGATARVAHETAADALNLSEAKRQELSGALRRARQKLRTRSYYRLIK